MCGGIAGATCGDDEVCQFANGTCGDGDQQGLCVDRPEVCPDLWEPMCGCDGHTYSNRCDALRAGVSVRHRGECARPGCRDDADCKDDQFCEEPLCGLSTIDDTGTVVAAVGICVDVPEVCDDLYAPVCGCDGRTYPNDCVRRGAEVSKLHDGPCEPRSCGDNGECNPDEYCAKAGCDGVGSCEPRPVVCPDVYAPVCGCDGKTYSNDCFRIGAGAQKDHDGRCECPPPAPCAYCPWGFVLDANGCGTCECNPPPIEACCDPNDRPGTGAGEPCFYGSTCCSHGSWRCNDASGGSTCGATSATAANADRPPAGPGRVCAACCDPTAELGADGTAACIEGATCCADGKWHCNDASAGSTCDVKGQVCDCPAPACTIMCSNGFAEDERGCATCRCNPPPCEDSACPATCNGTLVTSSDDLGCSHCECQPCCDPQKRTCGADARLCPSAATPK